MRCVECVTEPLTPGHYCECCGRKLSLQERRGLQTAAAPVAPPPEPAAPAEPAASAVGRESCAGPSDKGNLPATVAETPVVEASPAFADVVMRLQGDLEAAEAAGARAAAARRESAEAEAARLTAARAAAERIEAARLEFTKIQPIKLEAGKQDAAKAQAAKNKVAPIEARRPAPGAATPAAASKRYGSVQARQGAGLMVRRVAAAAVIVVATGLGLGAYWFKIQRQPIAAETQPTPVAPTAAVTERPSTSPDPVAGAEAATQARAVASAPERATPAPSTAAPKTKTAPSSVVPPRVPPKPAREVTAPTRQVASAFVSAGVTDAPVHVAAQPEPVAVAPPPPTPSAAPLRPFFESRDVNESPQVAKRVEPRLPDDLRARELNDIVIVRLLVSQSGQPSSVSLLRRSKAGQSLDDVVVAAVKQWTFSPARKNGEAVSCWLNVGVPVGRAN